ncbi:HET-domain-containing protein, partial [Ophiobolus disseminans]
MTYAYQALDNTPGAIRILVLYPAQRLDDPISGDLQHVSHESHRYTAVSYVWGNPSHVHSIQISGQEFGVADNLFNVLRSLRDAAEPISLWIDAICINQNDIPERNTQVQKMASIYRSAVEVVGCLGSTRPDFDIGFSLLKKLLIDDEELYLEDSYIPAWEGLVALLDKPYWTRVWILQE